MKYGSKKTFTIFLVMLLPFFTGIAAVLVLENPIFFIAGYLLGMPLSFIFANLLLRHPIIDALLGNGNLCFAVTETGQWLPFIVRPNGGYIQGVVRGLKIEGIMDRSLMQFMGKPGKGTIESNINEGKIILKLDVEEYNRSRHYSDEIGFFIYSMKLKQFLTKEMVSTLENETFSKHMITYTAYKVRELTSILRDFSRSYVDLYKENKPIWEQAWFKFLVIGAIVLIVGYFLFPYIAKALAPAVDTGAKALQSPNVNLHV